MILKASQRGGGKQLGLHLMKREENEHVEVHEIQGFISDDIVAALKEAHAFSKGTKCKQFLFSVSLSPPPDERVPVETFESAIQRIEQRTGLDGHPRIIVFHEKEGRRHVHAVWSRIDAETMTAKNLPFFKIKMRDLSRELYLENGWKMPRGLMNSREADPRNFALAEWQQAKRMGHDARDLKEIMQECWAVSDSKAAFMQALKARGFTLAKGDRRGHVAVTPEGEVLSVARYTGKKTKEIEKRLGSPETLPGVEAAKAQLAKDLTANFLRLRREAQEQKKRELEPIDKQRGALAQHHRDERAGLHAAQKGRWVEESHARAARYDRGAKGIWSRLSGQHAETQKRNEREAYAALSRDRAQRQSLIEAQMTDRQALQAQIKAVRDHHAALFKEIRAEQHAVRQFAKPEAAPNIAKTFAQEARPSPSIDERIERLRRGESRPRASRDRDIDRER